MAGTTGDSLEVMLRPSTGELRALAEQAEAFAEGHRLTRKAIDAMLLALEEAVTNVLMYAFEGVPQESRDVTVRLRKTANALLVAILDNGMPFDTATARPQARLDHDRPGGFGIRLIHSLVDEVRYSRIGNTNQLELVVYIEPDITEPV